MVYTYLCFDCKQKIFIEKPMSEASREEKCECGCVLKRVYETVGIKTGDGVKLG